MWNSKGSPDSQIHLLPTALNQKMIEKTSDNETRVEIIV